MYIIISYLLYIYISLMYVYIYIYVYMYICIMYIYIYIMCTYIYIYIYIYGPSRSDDAAGGGPRGSRSRAPRQLGRIGNYPSARGG